MFAKPQPQTLSLDAALQQALAHHKEGRLQQAERLYRTILQARPELAEVNYNMGVLSGQMGQSAAGLPYLKAALAFQPSNERFVQSYGEALLASGQPKQALEVVRAAVQRGVNTGAIKSLLEKSEVAVQSLSTHAVGPTVEEKSALVALFNNGQFVELESQASALTLKFPLSGFAWSVLGTALQMQGKDAQAALEKTAALLPGDASAHNNLGVALRRAGHIDRSVASFCRALEITPDFADAHINLGNALRDLKRHADAQASYRRALALKPDSAEAHRNLGLVLTELGQLTDAVANYRQALALKPDIADVYGQLGNTLKLLGQPDEALACFKKQLAQTPDDAEVQHHVATLSENNTERAPAQYVEAVFDSHAASFDTHLQQNLKYNTPQVLTDFIRQQLAPAEGAWDVLDLGCGTGLSGLAFLPLARSMVGVDLSSKMLEIAQGRNIYQRLEHQDLLAMMQAEASASFDAVIAADVFVYIGKLDEIFSEAKRLLRPSGILSFSIEFDEALAQQMALLNAPRTYKLQKSGRYAHFPEYIQQLVDANGFAGVELQDAQLRIEAGQPIMGKLVLIKI